MKTSNKILIITGLVIIVLAFTSLIGSRILLNKYTNSYDMGELNYTNTENE